MLRAFVNCTMVLTNVDVSISSFSYCQRWNKDHRARVNCGGVVFPKLDRCNFDCKFRNEKKNLIQLRRAFSPPTSKLVT
jgi:hypothetical protein